MTHFVIKRASMVDFNESHVMSLDYMLLDLQKEVVYMHPMY